MPFRICLGIFKGIFQFEFFHEVDYIQRYDTENDL